jgi:hypothetical protein
MTPEQALERRVIVCDYCDEHGSTGVRRQTEDGRWMDLRHAPKLGALADRRQGGRAR